MRKHACALSLLSIVVIVGLHAGQTSAAPGPGDPTPEQFGALGDGIHDDTFAIQQAVATGRQVWLEPGKTYRIAARIDIPSGSGFASDGTAWLLLGTQSGEFDNGDPSNRKATNAVGLYADRTEKVKLEGFGIRMEYRDGIYLRAVSVYRSTEFVARNLEITGLSTGTGIVVESTRDALVEDNYIHNFHSNHTSWAQLTGIEADNDRDDEFGPSDNVLIVNNIIENITVSQEFDRSFGYQTDGINVASPYTTNFTISGNRITNVGEGIDVFGADQRIFQNRITNVAYFGVKLVHGARRVTVRDNTIDRAGSAGIILSGGINKGLNDKREPVTENLVVGNTITRTGQADMGYTVVVRASPPVGIYLEGREDGHPETGQTLTSNTISNNRIEGRGPMYYGILCSNGLDIKIAGNEIKGAEREPILNMCGP